MLYGNNLNNSGKRVRSDGIMNSSQSFNTFAMILPRVVFPTPAGPIRRKLRQENAGGMRERGKGDQTSFAQLLRPLFLRLSRSAERRFCRHGVLL